MKYSAETKIEAINLSSRVGCAEAAKRLSMPVNAITKARWEAKRSGMDLSRAPRKIGKWCDELADKIEFVPAKPKEESRGVEMEEVIRRFVREKRNQYSADEKKKALILADMLGAAKAAEETGIKVGTIYAWRKRAVMKAKMAKEEAERTEKESWYQKAIFELSQKVSALEAMIKTKFGAEKNA